MSKLYLFFPALLLMACAYKTEKIKPTFSSVTESVYASGTIKSKDQYEAFATVNGTIEQVFVSEGDTVRTGTPILSISSEAQKLLKENAELAAQFSDYNTNKDKLEEAKRTIELSRIKMDNDSALFTRQKRLWDRGIGTKIELEQREIAYENSKTAYYSSLVRHDDLMRQLDFASSQSKKNLMISVQQENDFTLRSEIDGMVYSLFKSKGELVDLQSPLAVLGDIEHFILEMQVDEYDIFKIKEDLSVLVTMDSYRGEVFEAKITKINPLMNERSKTFLVEAEFVRQPEVLYPNITFEANIVLDKKEKALLIPRNYLLNDSMVVKSNGDKVVVKTGLKDFQKIEIISGIGPEDELKIPVE